MKGSYEQRPPTEDGKEPEIVIRKQIKTESDVLEYVEYKMRCRGNQFLEYEFSANNLDQFNGFTIKIVMSSTNQAYPPRFKDLRGIAIR